MHSADDLFYTIGIDTCMYFYFIDHLLLILDYFVIILDTIVLTKQWRTVFLLEFYIYGSCIDTKILGIL